MGRAGRAAVIFVGALVFFLGLGLASRDDPRPQDADLIPWAAPVSDADNAYPLVGRLNTATSLSPKEREVLGKLVDGKIADESAASDFLARSTESLALFGELSRRPAFQDPAFRNLAAVAADTKLPQFYGVVTAAKLSSLQAESLLKKGRAPEALAQSLLIVDAGRLFMRGRQQLIEQLVGMMLMEIGVKRALEIASRGKLGRARLLDAAARLSAPSNAAAGLQDSFRYEYVVQANTLDHLPELTAKMQEEKKADPTYKFIIGAAAKGGFYVYMPHRTKALFADRYRRMIAEAGKPCLLMRPAANEMLPYWFRPNMVGRILYDLAIPAYEKISVRRCAMDYRVSAAAAAAAIQAYRLDHGRFPEGLNDLTPRYLPSVPLDPFNGSALLYSANTGEVRSAGKDSDGKPL